MFAPSVVGNSIFSAIKAGSWAIAVAGFGLLLAGRGGDPSRIAAAIAVFWAVYVLARHVFDDLAQPTRWLPMPVCRGRHDGRCALTIDVKFGEEQEALSLCTFLQGRGVAATFFVPSGVDGLVRLLRSCGHELGGLNGQVAESALARGTSPWENRTLPADCLRIGWSVLLVPHAAPAKASRVVATDIVRISTRTSIATLSSWLDDWDRRAVVASTLSAALTEAR